MKGGILMKRNIIGLILNAIIFVLWSFVGISKAVAEPSWICLVYGALMAIYLAITISYIRDVVKLAKAKNLLKKTKVKSN